ncbi:MAG: DUF86 domain-containing protein [Rhodocyclaceae bacterium]
MLRPEFVRRKLQLIAEDLGRLLHYKEETWEAITADFVKLAAIERLIERIVMRAIDINEHLIAELGKGTEPRTARLTYRETFLRLADPGVYPKDFAERIARSASLRNILVHDYNDADRRIVCGAIRPCLEDYRYYVESVAAFIDRIEASSR